MSGVYIARGGKQSVAERSLTFYTLAQPAEGSRVRSPSKKMKFLMNIFCHKRAGEDLIGCGGRAEQEGGLYVWDGSKRV